MGLNKIYLDYILESLAGSIGDLKGKKMLELGDQVITEEGITEKTGKEYFEKIGVIHTSIDLNGLNGAIKIDLSKPVSDLEWLNHFDIITNAGTSEHIEPKEGQFECFKNVHNWLKVGGIAIHLIPDIDELEERGFWKKHCNNYYSHSFFKMLAKNNGYEIESLKIVNGLICSCLRKKIEMPFMEDRREFLNYINRKKGGIVYEGINETVIQRIYRLPYRMIYRIAKKIYHLFGIKALIAHIKAYTDEKSRYPKHMG